MLVIPMLITYILALPNYSSALTPTPTVVITPTVSPGDAPIEDRVDAFNYRGNFYAQNDNLEKAISNYSIAIDLDPNNNAFGYCGRGLAYYRSGDLEKAILDFDKTILIEPDYVIAYVGRGEAYRDMGNLDQAVADFSRAIEIEPTNARAYYNRGAIYYKTGLREKAVSDFERYLEFEPNPPNELVSKIEGLKSRSVLPGVYLSLTVIAGIILAVWWLKRKNIYSSSYPPVEIPQQEGVITCDNCNCVSSMPEAFKSTETERLCPRCFQKEEYRSLARTFRLIFDVIIISTLLAIMLFWFGLPWHYLFSNIVLAGLFWYVTIVLYVVVQAGTALLVGGKVFLLQVGTGPVLFTKLIGIFQFTLGKFPDRSFTHTGYPKRSAMKLRLATFYMSGLLLHGIIVLLLLSDFEPSNFLSAYAFREIFLLTNAYMLYTIIIPRQSNNAGLLRRLFTEQIDLDALHANCYVMKSERAFLKKHLEEAHQACEAGLGLYPQDTTLRNYLAILLNKLGEPSQALQILKETLSRPDLSPIQRALTMNNFSWVTLSTGKDTEAAYDYAQQTFRMAPWVPSFEGTFGAALVEVGEIEQGIYHLLQAYEHHPTCSNQATNLAYAAIGYYRLGDAEQAKERLEQALAIDMDAEIVQKAQQELGL